MNRYFLIYLVVLLFLLNCSEKGEEKSLKYLLPTSEDLKGWKPVDAPKQYEGEDLFLLINGGAEIYHEYGFKRVIAQEYKSDNEKSVNLEIFEMKNPSFSYGIYTFKTGKEGKKYAIGNECLLEDYYINFWKGSFLVTLTGFDSESETLNGIVSIARAVDVKIAERGEKPDLIELLPDENLVENSVKYLKGNLALYNCADLSSEITFDFVEGVKGEYGSYDIYILKYATDSDAQKKYLNVEKSIKKSSGFNNILNMDYGFSVQNKENKFIVVNRFKGYILMVQGVNPRQAGVIIAGIINKIGEIR